MLKVLHIGKFFPPFAGGIENFMADLMDHCAQADCEVAALVHQHQIGRPFSRESIGTEGAKFTVYRTPSYGSLIFAPLSPLFAHHLKIAIEEFRPDILHVHVPNVSAFWLPITRVCRGLPLVVHWHADVVPSSHHRALMMAYRFYRPFEQALLRRADAIIATSPPYLQTSPALSPWRSKCHVIPLGISDAAPPAAAAGVPKFWDHAGAFRILCVGRLTYYKGHEYLIDAVAGLPEARLLIVGEGSRRSALQKRIDALGLADRVELHGRASSEDLLSFFRACDCLCLPSIERTEAFGLVLLEAMRLRKACIATDVAGSGMSWVVEEGKTGLIASAGDTESLRHALLSMRDDSLRTQLGNAGGHRFVSHFTIKRAGDSILALYRTLTMGEGTTGDRE